MEIDILTFVVNICI